MAQGSLDFALEILELDHAPRSQDPYLGRDLSAFAIQDPCFSIFQRHKVRPVVSVKDDKPIPLRHSLHFFSKSRFKRSESPLLLAVYLDSEVFFNYNRARLEIVNLAKTVVLLFAFRRIHFVSTVYLPLILLLQEERIIAQESNTPCHRE